MPPLFCFYKPNPVCKHFIIVLVLLPALASATCRPNTQYFFVFLFVFSFYFVICFIHVYCFGGTLLCPNVQILSKPKYWFLLVLPSSVDFTIPQQSFWVFRVFVFYFFFTKDAGLEVLWLCHAHIRLCYVTSCFLVSRVFGVLLRVGLQGVWNRAKKISDSLSLAMNPFRTDLLFTQHRWV